MSLSQEDVWTSGERWLCSSGAFASGRLGQLSAPIVLLRAGTVVGRRSRLEGFRGAVEASAELVGMDEGGDAQVLLPEGHWAGRMARTAGC